MNPTYLEQLTNGLVTLLTQSVLPPIVDYVNSRKTENALSVDELMSILHLQSCGSVCIPKEPKQVKESKCIPEEPEQSKKHQEKEETMESKPKITKRKSTKTSKETPPPPPPASSKLCQYKYKSGHHKDRTCGEVNGYYALEGEDNCQKCKDKEAKAKAKKKEPKQSGLTGTQKSTTPSVQEVLKLPFRTYPLPEYTGFSVMVGTNFLVNHLENGTTLICGIQDNDGVSYRKLTEAEKAMARDRQLHLWENDEDPMALLARHSSVVNNEPAPSVEPIPSTTLDSTESQQAPPAVSDTPTPQQAPVTVPDTPTPQQAPVTGTDTPTPQQAPVAVSDTFTPQQTSTTVPDTLAPQQAPVVVSTTPTPQQTPAVPTTPTPQQTPAAVSTTPTPQQTPAAVPDTPTTQQAPPVASNSQMPPGFQQMTPQQLQQYQMWMQWQQQQQYQQQYAYSHPPPANRN